MINSVEQALHILNSNGNCVWSEFLSTQGYMDESTVFIPAIDTSIEGFGGYLVDRSSGTIEQVTIRNIHRAELVKENSALVPTREAV